jgi:hypothetical protein
MPKSFVSFFNSLSSSSSSQAVEAPTYNTSIKRLNLIPNTCHADESLTEVLTTNPTITHLSLETMTHYSYAVRQAFSSQSLQSLKIHGFVFYQGTQVSILDNLTIPNTSQLSSVSLTRGYVNVHVFEVLKKLPLRKLKLKSLELYGDTFGDTVIDVIKTVATTIEEIDLSDNWLCRNKNKERGERSKFISQFSAVLEKCSRLRSFKMINPRDYYTFELIGLVRKMKLVLPNIQELGLYYPEPSSLSSDSLQNHITEHIKFLVQDIELKEQENSSLYIEEINRIISGIYKIINSNSHKNTSQFLSKSRAGKEVNWLQEHQAALKLAKENKFDEFHATWSRIKQEKKDSDKYLEPELSIMLDMLEETILLYANAKGSTISSSYKNQKISVPGYEAKIDNLFGKVQEEEKAADNSLALS